MLNIGFIQFNPVLGNATENISRLQPLVEKAKCAHLAVIPELANSGYNFESREQAFGLSEDVSRSLFVEFIVAKAREQNMFIVAGINERSEDKLYNSAILAGPNGLVGKYRKVHLFMNERDFFERGESEPEVYDTGLCRTGMLICFDWIFPEFWRILALKGADIICHPSNLVLPYAQQAVPVHGLINRIFIITANRTGSENDLTFTGQSFISDPAGNILYKAAADKEEVGIVGVYPTEARNKMITIRNHAFGDRVPLLYKALINEDQKTV
jgi:predicted amidohydrolase